MGKLGVIYWSQTGNTKAMADAIAEGAAKAGADVDLFSVSEVDGDKAASYEKLALGCPAMGAEVLEEDEFEPFFQDIENRLPQKIALFGSYGWGEGQWMYDWQERVVAQGVQLFQGKGLMVHETPDSEGLEACRQFGADFAAF